MDAACSSKLKRKRSPRSFCGSPAPMRAQRAAAAAALLRAGLLLGALRWCACLEAGCVLGVVGRPVSLPCVRPELRASANVSVEWRRDGRVVFRAAWTENGSVDAPGVDSPTVPADAAKTGNLSLELPAVHPSEDRTLYSMFVISGGRQSPPLCTVCLSVAASYSSPQLVRDEAAQGDEKAFLCHSSGGYPPPAVYWLINDTEEPPAGSVRTVVAPLPDSLLYNITSHLTVNISDDSSISCVIDNQSMNETLTSTTYAVEGSPVVSRASSAMWMFSTGLCVVVGVMVLAGVAYQIHLDKINKMRKEEHQQPQRGYKRRHLYMDEEEPMKQEPKKTDV